MAAGHGQAMHVHGHSPVHRAPAHLKILTLFGFMLLVVATPGHWYPAYGVWLALVLAVVLVARVPFGWLLPRMLVEVPFVVFAVLMPVIARGPQIEVLGVSVSESGLLAAWTLLAKGTLGVIAGLTLAATTSPPELVGGLERLRLPSALVQIAAFMIRYLEVVADDLRRQNIALASRGFVARDPRHWPVLAKSVGALFIRSYERGERVHLAMLARGYEGRMPS